MEMLLGFGQQLRRDTTHVVERLAARDPRDGGVAAAIDGSVDGLTGANVHDVQDRLFVATDGELVGNVVALLGWLPRIQRRQSGRVNGHRIEELTFLGRTRIDRVKHSELLTGLATHHKCTLAAPVGRRHSARTQQLTYARAEVLPEFPFRTLGIHQGRLLRRPLLGTRIGGILEPAVGVSNRATMEVVNEIEARCSGVLGHAPTLLRPV